MVIQNEAKILCIKMVILFSSIQHRKLYCHAAVEWHYSSRWLWWMILSVLSKKLANVIPFQLLWKFIFEEPKI